MAYDKENIFAKILRGEIPCDKIYEDDYVLSFRDIRPQAPSHALIIPKGEYVDINDFSANASDHEIVGFNKAISKGQLQTAAQILDSLGKVIGESVETVNIQAPELSIKVESK